MDHPLPIGTRSHGSLLLEDLLYALHRDLLEASEIEESGDHARFLKHLSDTCLGLSDTDDHEQQQEALNEALEFIQDYVPPYCYYGMHPGDGSDLGVWPDWDEIGELPQVDDPYEPFSFVDCVLWERKPVPVWKNT
jgi:hypothetical protein